MRRLAWVCLAITATCGAAAAAAEGPAETPVIELRPAAPPEPARELMRRWRDDCRGRLSPVLREWQSLEWTGRGWPGDGQLAGCRRLDLALSRLARDRLPVAPDPSVSLHLEETLRSLSDAARSCTHGAYFLAAWRLREAADSWRELRGRLLLYGLAP